MNRQENFDKYTSLREKYQIFSFEGFDYHINGNSIHVIFRFSVDNTFFFKPKTTFFLKSCTHINNEDIKILLFHVGMVELISYWKAFCTKKVLIKPFLLDNTQIQWWKKLYFQGLGEFFWLNSIHADPKEFMEIQCESENALKPVECCFSENDTHIVPVGGGKDSVVSLEFLKSADYTVKPMLVNPRKAMTDSVEAAEIPISDCFIIERTIDPLLLKLNDQGYLNGHTPFSSLLAFHSLIVSCATGISNVALSNESSANEATVPGTNINHQYSKSFEFESDFKSYVHQYLHPQMNYFSILRPLSELQIAHVFSRFDKYHHLFRSCNTGSKQNIWCGQCSKCLFTAIIMLPFMGPKKVNIIFGYDIFNNEKLLHVFDQLIGKAEVKPFECVGTPDEINLALSFAIKQHYSDKNLPVLLAHYMKNELFCEISKESFFNIIMEQFDNQHYLTTNLYEQLREFVRTV